MPKPRVKRTVPLATRFVESVMHGDVPHWIWAYGMPDDGTMQARIALVLADGDADADAAAFLDAMLPPSEQDRVLRGAS